MGKRVGKSAMSGALILTVSALISKLVGAIYRIPLTYILGAEGMGMYQLIFPVYALLLTLSSSAVPVAISRLVAEQNGYEEKNKIFSTSKILLFVLSLLGLIIIISFAPIFAGLQGNKEIVGGYYAIAPSILLVGGIAGFRGFFQGNLNMIPTAVSNLTEQIFKLIFGLTLSVYLLKYGIVYGVIGALIGVSLSELVTFICMYLFYIKSKNRIKFDYLKEFKTNGKKIVKIAFPILIGSIIFPLTQFIDSFIIVNILSAKGLAVSEATSIYGILTGPVNSLINLPVVLSLSVAIIIIPSVSKLRKEMNINSLKEFSEFSIKAGLITSVPFCLFFIFFSKSIIAILYPSFSAEEINISSGLLKFASVNIIFLSQMQILTSILQALDRVTLPVKITFIGAVSKVILTVAFMFSFGITGAVVASVISYMFTMILSLINYRKLVGKRMDKKSFIKVFAISGGSVISGFIVYFLMKQTLTAFILSAIIAILLYLFFLLAANLFSEKEISLFWGGKYILKLSKRIRFWERNVNQR